MNEPILYQIRGWDDYFEHAGSRGVDHCRMGAIPNKQQGLPYRRTVSTPEGMQLYAAFVGIVLACSTHRKAGAGRTKRQGWLTDNGNADGMPWTPNDLHHKTGMPEAIIAAALGYFSDPKHTGKDTWIIRHGGNEAEIHVVNAPQTVQEPPEDKPLTLAKRIQYNDAQGIYGYTEADIEDWAEAFPALDILQELRALSAWAKANPSKRKKNWARFVTNCFSRKQDEGGSRTSTKDQLEAQRKDRQARAARLRQELTNNAEVLIMYEREGRDTSDFWKKIYRDHGKNAQAAKKHILAIAETLGASAT